MVLEAFGQALQSFTDPELWLFMTAGVFIGLILGIIPGIGGLIGMALLLPFVFKMSPVQALPLLVALSAVSYTGGAITAILVNIPGMDTNAATLIDGFPMSQKGEAGRALGAALISSGLGGLATVFLALAMTPLILPMVMALRSADMVFIVLVGIVFIAVLGKGSMVKGLISGGLGLVLSFVGLQIVTGAPRFTFGMVYLFDGVGLIPLVLGLFAVPEAIVFAAKGGTMVQEGVVIRGMSDVWEGAKDVFRHWGLWLRSTIVGYVIGIIPGVGATTATFLAYGQAKQISKHPERFGTGIVEGVIAPESANNAKEAGSLLTTLALGIPGSAAMAILLGAFLMLGLVPGPAMLTVHLDLSVTLLLIIVVSNVMAVAICLPAAPYLARIATIPSRILAPLVVIISFVGAFAYRGLFNDVIVTLIFTAIGLALRQFGYNRPSLFLGFILGVLFEKYLFISLSASGPLFFMRPISLTLIVVIIGVMALDSIRNLIRRKRGVKRT